MLSGNGRLTVKYRAVAARGAILELHAGQCKQFLTMRGIPAIGRTMIVRTTRSCRLLLFGVDSLGGARPSTVVDRVRAAGLGD